MPFDQQRYEQLRAEMIDRNEANVQNLYLDVYGIPTVGLGVALTARQRNGTIAVDRAHLDALADVLNLDDGQRRQLGGLLDDHVVVQNRHPRERYNNLHSFLASDFGASSERVLGPMVNTRHTSDGGGLWSWDVLTSPQSPMRLQITHEQSIALFNRIPPEYETRLDATLRRVHCPPEALSEEQRAALYSMVYQGAIDKARGTADAIGDYWRGELTEGQLRARLRTAADDPAFPGRSRNELAFLEHIEPRPARAQAAHHAASGDSRLPPNVQDAIHGPRDQRVHPQHQGHAEHQRMRDGDRPRGNDIQFGAPDDVASPLHRQAEAAVRRLDELMGKGYDSHSACMAASLACLAKENGLQRIDHVVPYASTPSLRAGENVFVVQGGIDGATNRVAHTKTQDAVAAPVEHSLRQMAAVVTPQALDQAQHIYDAAKRQPAHRMTV